MRNVRAVVMVLVVSVAGSAFAGAKKAPKANSFDDLFGAVDAANKSTKAKPAKVAKAAKPAAVKPSAKSAAHKPALVAAANTGISAPTPKADPDQLVLSDYAPNRHAWAGP